MFKEELEKIKKEAQQRLESSESLDMVNEIRVGVLGKKGSLKEILKGMKNVPAEERPQVGQMVNEVRQQIEEAIAKAQKSIERKVQEQRLASETIDVTLPSKRLPKGHSHPNVIVLKELERIFVGMGYEVIEGPEVERDYYNFEALNIPADHPAKDIPLRRSRRDPFPDFPSGRRPGRRQGRHFCGPQRNPGRIRQKAFRRRDQDPFPSPPLPLHRAQR